MAGSYCFRCGQSDTDLDVPIRQFAGEFLSESFDLDSRLRSTLGPLFLRPGQVAAEYVAGHRARFVPPVRLYVFASFVMFLVLSLTSEGVVLTTSGSSLPDTAVVESGATSDPTPAADPEDGAAPSFSDRMTEGVRRAQEDPSRFSEVFLGRMAQAMFLLLPAFALLLKVFHPHRLYVHHLVFAVYFHSFAFLIVAAAEVVEATRIPVLAQGAGAALLLIPAHLLLGIRRFYAQGWMRSLFKWLAVSMAYFLILSVTMLGLILVALLAGA